MYNLKRMYKHKYRTLPVLHCVIIIDQILLKPFASTKDINAIHARIQEFREGGSGQTDKKALTTFFFSPQLILHKSNGEFQKISFSRFQRGSNIFQGGPTFSRGGGGPIAYFL